MAHLGPFFPAGPINPAIMAMGYYELGVESAIAYREGRYTDHAICTALRIDMKAQEKREAVADLRAAVLKARIRGDRRAYRTFMRQIGAITRPSIIWRKPRGAEADSAVEREEMHMTPAEQHAWHNPRQFHHGGRL